jgi:hypothetical protein
MKQIRSRESLAEGKEGKNVRRFLQQVSQSTAVA